MSPSEAQGDNDYIPVQVYVLGVVFIHTSHLIHDPNLQDNLGETLKRKLCHGSQLSEPKNVLRFQIENVA